MNTSHLKNQNTSSNLVHRRNPSGPAKKKKQFYFLQSAKKLQVDDVENLRMKKWVRVVFWVWIKTVRWFAIQIMRHRHFGFWVSLADFCLLVFCWSLIKDFVLNFCRCLCYRWKSFDFELFDRCKRDRCLLFTTNKKDKETSTQIIKDKEIIFILFRF